MSTVPDWQPILDAWRPALRVSHGPGTAAINSAIREKLTPEQVLRMPLEDLLACRQIGVRAADMLLAFARLVTMGALK